jgi:hypothetical protein
MNSSSRFNHSFSNEDLLLHEVKVTELEFLASEIPAAVLANAVYSQ